MHRSFLGLASLLGFVLLASVPAAQTNNPDAAGYELTEISDAFVALDPATVPSLALVAGSETSLALPFAFPFYGNSYSDITVDTYGALRFGVGPAIANVNDCLPLTSGDAPDVMVYWDELYPRYIGAVHEPALDRFVVSWQDVHSDPAADSDDPGAWQVHLYSSGRIEMHYAEVNIDVFGDHDNGEAATVGVQDIAGSTSGLGNANEYNCNDFRFGWSSVAFEQCADADGDGFRACVDDCDDNSAAVYPGNNEVICDGVDNDCDPLTPDAFDFDNDGFTLCDDCDEQDPLVNPGMPENHCNAIDDDCNTLTLDDPPDQDGDGVEICQGDCNDAAPSAYPGGTEACDGLDNDCNGFFDYGAPGTNGNEADSDGDGVRVCQLDCDDGQAAVFPGNPEICDGLDNDCDGNIPAPEQIDDDGDTAPVCIDCDDSDPARSPWFTEACDGLDSDCDGAPLPTEVDTDNDGFLACNECDDLRLSVYPGAPELCDGLDTACTGSVPANESEADMDGQRPCAGDCDDSDPMNFAGNAEICDEQDNDCDPATVFAGEDVDDDFDGWVACADCDDTDWQSNPDEIETCDYADNDCNGEIDDTLPHVVYYPDDDEDGYGDSNHPGERRCDGPPNFHIEDSSDCDDSEYYISPDQPEECDDLDNNCDGLIDEGFGVDLDADGFSAPDACSGTMDDCDDTKPSFYPGAPEECDGLDGDCDGAVPADEIDADGDLSRVCHGDCDDNDPNTGTWLPEDCGNGIDDNCNGLIDEDQDLDGDGYGTCLDCNDSDPDINPGVVEICDGFDSNCDGLLLPEEIDTDGDQVGECQGDCGPDEFDVGPYAPEICDAKDNDCDGVLHPEEEPSFDLDMDGFVGCVDCDDFSDEIYPGAPEDPCLPFDFDCDGELPDPDDCEPPDVTFNPPPPPPEETGCGSRNREASLAERNAALFAFLPVLGLLGLRRRAH